MKYQDCLNTIQKVLFLKLFKKKLKRFFINLSSDELLSRCLEGTNQNANEAFNQILWRKCPKNTFVSKDVLEMGTLSSVVNFNDEFLALANVLKNLHLTPGKYFIDRALVFDSKESKIYTQKINGYCKEQKKKVKSYKEKIY